MKTPQRVKSKETREKIFSAVAQIMKKHGKEYLTVANICEIAQVSKGTFFYHFNTKDELLLCYIQEGFDDFSKSEKKESASNDIYTLVFHAITMYLTYCQSLGTDFLSSYYSPKNKALDTHYSSNADKTLVKLENLCCDFFSSAQKESFIRKDWEAATLAADCCSIVKGCIFNWCISEGKIDLISHTEHLIHCYFSSITTPKYKKAFSSKKHP